MRKEELSQKVKELGKDIFTITDLKKLFPKESYIKSSLKRFKDSGFVVQIIKGVYSLKSDSLNIEKIATQIYYPSYISFESALSKYGIINQGFYKLTLATTRHSKKTTLAEVEVEYSKIKESLFFGFNFFGETYIAEPEKAFLDELYLITKGFRTQNFSEWNLENLDKTKIKKYLGPYSKSVKKLAMLALTKLN